LARRRQKSDAEERRERNRAAIWEARRTLGASPLARLFGAVTVQETPGEEGDPETAAVDPVQGVIWVNLRRKTHDGGHWARVLGHMLLHLGLNHAARREEREPLLWNLACDEAADRLLPFFKIGSASPGYASADRREEEIYAELLERQQARKAGRAIRQYQDAPATYAGKGRPDILGIGRFQPWRHDYENLLAEGIQTAVEDAVFETAAALGDAQDARAAWAPGERAKRWVLNELPLLGAVATQVRIIADAQLCDRMDIPIAAVDGFLGEMYFHPSWNFSHEELVFIYVHELLHVALLHHSRGRGRDPWLYNVACDFVINGWLVEMGVGRLPGVGALYDPRLQGMSADEVYDLLVREPRRRKGLRGFRGKLGDILWDSPGRRIHRGDVTTLDDVYRRCLQAGLSCMGRGTVPAGLLEEIRALFAPAVPWDVELARWMEAHVPTVRDPLRTYARASRRQASTPDIPRPARYVPQEWLDACTFGVVMDTSGSMDRELLGRALGAIASYSEARDVPRVRLVLCDAAPYDQGFVAPTDLRGIYPVKGRGGTVLQPAVNFLISRPDFPASAPVMILTDGWCEEELTVPREHCFVLPRKRGKDDWVPLRTSAPVFRVLKEEYYEEEDD
jgi:predicted metal-dependent peptidase